jgi:L-gulonolactone oxidase
VKPRRFTNWAGQYSCVPRVVERPTTTAEVQRIVRGARASGRRLRVFGSGYSPSDIAMSDDVLIVLDRMARVLAIDVERRTITVEAGATLKTIDAVLRVAGLALPNLGSIAAQTIVGAVATGTHGTGVGYGVLSTMVEEVTLVTGTGDVVRLAKGEHEAWLDAVRCHLGALAVITEVTLSVCPAFDLAVEERPADLDDVLSDLGARLRVDHYRFWYIPHADRVWEWSATRVPPAPDPPRPSVFVRGRQWMRETLLGRLGFELALLVATADERLVPHVNRAYARAMYSAPRDACGASRSMFTFDCLFKQHVDEWAIPLERTAEALTALRELITTRGFSAHLPIEVRFVKGDSIWLSPSYGRDSCYIGVIAYLPYGRTTRFREYFAAFESLMASLGGRPHWAKRFGPEAASLAPLYPRWNDFAALRATLDPSRVFANAYIERVLGTTDGSA